MKQFMQHYMKKVFRNQKGFTLVELMIVVAIIGILAAIAVPQFMAYRIRSYNAGAKAVAHNLKADEANLNSELGLYGHTEGGAAAAFTLQSGVANPAIAVAGVFIDTNATPALAVPATAATAGGRLAGANNGATRQLAIPIAMGSNMVATALSIRDAGSSSNFHLFARHFKGDTAYALDNDVENTVYSVSNPLWPNLAGAGYRTVNPTNAPASDINGVGGNGVPAANWTVLP